MKIILDDEHTLVTTPHYPWRLHRSYKTVSGHKVILGIGGNVGNVVRRFEHLFHYLKSSPYIRVLETTPMLKNPPFGVEEQPYFYNCVMLVSTPLTPRGLLMYLMRVEKHFGRKRTIKNGSRTLDIDIIFYDNISMETKDLTIPHPAWMRRNSVIIPLQWLKGQS